MDDSSCTGYFFNPQIANYLRFQTKKNDSNRLANRGGALLKEEKIRKGINRELPKVHV